MKHILAYDIGTTGVKTCLFGVDKEIKLIASAQRRYHLYTYPDGGAEQDEDEWWAMMGESTREVLADKKVIAAGVTSDNIDGISFCSQMQGVVLVDKEGKAVHHPLSYMDQRAKEEIKKGIAYGPQVAGANIFKLIPSLIITGAVTSSVKDPVWKYKWLEAHDKENFARAYKWFDVKDYLICRCTDEFKMTQDSAFGTLIYDTRKGKEGWSDKMCRMFDIKKDLLPEIIKSTDCAGVLTKKAADELGLVPSIKVFGGGGDTSCIAIGSGASKVGATHIYSGTSGWVITVTDKRKVDVNYMIAAITGAQDGKFNYFAEMETAGKSIQWVKEQILEDSVGLYGEASDIPKDNIYDFINEKIGSVTPGSGGVLYAPWLHGNRCPFEDPYSTGMFIGLKLETKKEELIRAVIEGVFYHLRWMLECEEKSVKGSDTIRFVGGTAQSKVMCQMLADILGRRVETVSSPQNAGSMGAAAIAAVGLGIIPGLDTVEDFIPADAVYEPDCHVHKSYEKFYQTFKKLYKSNAKLFKEIGLAQEELS